MGTGEFAEFRNGMR